MCVNLKKMAEESLRRDWCAKYGAGDPELDRHDRESRLMDFRQVASAVLDAAWARLKILRSVPDCKFSSGLAAGRIQIIALKNEICGKGKKA